MKSAGWTIEETQLCIDTLAKMKRAKNAAEYLSPILNRTVDTLKTRLSHIKRGMLTIKNGEIINPTFKLNTVKDIERAAIKSSILLPEGFELNFKPTRIEMSQGYMKVYF